jgi:hypothetical protein
MSSERPKKDLSLVPDSHGVATFRFRPEQNVICAAIVGMDK